MSRGDYAGPPIRCMVWTFGRRGATIGRRWLVRRTWRHCHRLPTLDRGLSERPQLVWRMVGQLGSMAGSGGQRERSTTHGRGGLRYWDRCVGVHRRLYALDGVQDDALKLMKAAAAERDR